MLSATTAQFSRHGMPILAVAFATLVGIPMSVDAQGILYSFDGDSEDDEFGFAVSGAGDVNGDDIPDLVVGARYDGNNGFDSGSVRVFSGANGSILYTFDGDATNAELGTAVSDAGDVNGDAFADVIAGAPGVSGAGAARVYSGMDGSILYTFTGDSEDDGMGDSVSNAGDVNGDNVPDLIAGARFDADNGLDSGAAWVFSGADGAILHKFRGDSAGDEFGTWVSGAGDVNGDDFADLIVGAPLDDNNGKDSGSARVFSGANGAVLYTFNGGAAGDGFGYAVSDAGDVDGDNITDLIVGAPGNDNNGADSGSARVFSGADGAILYTFNGETAGDTFGAAVSGAGDMNGDNTPDLIVGAPLSQTMNGETGSARVFSGVDGSVLFTFIGDGSFDFLGIGVSDAGDINEDGFGDVIVGISLDDNNGEDDSGSVRVFAGGVAACVDGDGDGYGAGPGCLGLDCDDGDAT
ncbi:MAG: FG-GAP repeat protein, partial [Myxococcales bacterium]|nr:FG-GAP repeat protein [Myxococcales bacterium]